MSNVQLFSSPEEIRHQKSLKKGITFTLLVCGQEGTGKSSFINGLCKQKVLERDSIHVDPKESHLNPGIDVVTHHINIVEENSTPIALDIVLTPGFGQNVDNTRCTSKIVGFLENHFEIFLNEECRIQRDPKFKDGRPHAALYFIRPTSKGLSELDVETMKHLSSRVNLIPVIGKADSLTSDEIKLNKALVLQDIKANNIQIYDFPVDSESNEETLSDISVLKKQVPFAVAGSYETELINDIPYHVRRYSWGIFKTEDTNHSDFTLLRNALFGSHLQELKDSTHGVLYENYRRERLPEREIYSKARFRNGEVSLLEFHNCGEKGEILQEDEAFREILKKKKVIEEYTSEIKLLEKRLNVSSLGQKTHKSDSNVVPCD
jgi:septin family protein